MGEKEAKALHNGAEMLHKLQMDGSKGQGRGTEEEDMVRME